VVLLNSDGASSIARLSFFHLDRAAEITPCQLRVRRRRTSLIECDINAPFRTAISRVSAGKTSKELTPNQNSTRGGRGATPDTYSRGGIDCFNRSRADVKLPSRCSRGNRTYLLIPLRNITVKVAALTESGVS
jgi:hypothetical protein